MIFNSNSTKLGNTINYPVNEKYDGTLGCAIALVESARNDFAMFKAALAHDMQEFNHSTSMNESAVIALNEATGDGFWRKIVDLLKKLGEKIKSIFYNVMAKLNGFFLKDKQLIKKYRTDILKKTYIGNLEVKWREVKNSPLEKIGSYIDSINDNTPEKILEDTQFESVQNVWKDESDERINHYIQQIDACKNSDVDSVEDDLTDYFFEDEEVTEIKDIKGGIVGIMNYLDGATTNIKKTKTNIDKVLNKIAKAQRLAEKEITKAGKGELNSNYTNKDANKEEYTKEVEDNVKASSKVFDLINAYSVASTKISNIGIKCMNIEYKQAKAAFMKAVTANNEKLKESTYLDAVAEAVEDEVDDALAAGIQTSDIQDLSNASDNILDTGVSNDPDKLVYDYDGYEPEEGHKKVAESYFAAIDMI